MIDDLKKSQCYGCNACGDICPKNAISFSPDIEGFLYPTIDNEKCINCGLCDKVCPHKNEISKDDTFDIQCVAANHKHLDIRFDSTSGGAFTALAESFIKEGGYVGGAIYTEDWHVRQIITNSIDDLSKLRSSKYIQSDAQGFYKKAKELLDNGERLLLVGLPCQIAALKCYLNKDYKKLIVVELICRYINSPAAYQKYLDYLENKYQSKIVYIKPKNKELGWRRLTHKVVFENGKTYYGTFEVDKFMQASMKSNCLARPSCYNCEFKGFPRAADITLGDYWVSEKRISLDDDTGTSVIILNTSKGLEYFNRIRKYLRIENVVLDDVIQGNKALTSPLPKENNDREVFFNRLSQEPFDKVVDEMCPQVLTFKKKVKNILGAIRREIKYSRMHPVPLIQFIVLNFFHPAVKSSLVRKNVIYTTPHCVFQIDRGARIELDGYLIVGHSPFKHSKLETRIRMEKGSRLVIGGFGRGGYAFGYGSDIELFENAILESKGGPPTNMNTTIICKNKIYIGEMTAIGRNVTIRDNNGGHLININGYIDARPVIIGEHVWLCEGSTVLSGVKIGDGTIVGAGCVVNKSLPPHVSVSGNPVKIGSEGIEWKM